MIDIEKQIAYWKDGAEEELGVARHLLEVGRIRQGLFFVHLALEKALKAHVCKHTGQLAPRIHGLISLAERSGLNLTPEQLDILSEITPLHIEGRYSETPTMLPTPERAKYYLKRAEGVYEWLMNQL